MGLIGKENEKMIREAYAALMDIRISLKKIADYFETKGERAKTLGKNDDKER